MLRAIEQSVIHYKPYMATLENTKEDSPIHEIDYIQCISGSKKTVQSVHITITIRLKKNHDQCAAIKELLLQHYREIVDRQAIWEYEDFKINAKDLKEVVTLLGPTYLSDSVFSDLGLVESAYHSENTNHTPCLFPKSESFIKTNASQKNKSAFGADIQVVQNEPRLDQDAVELTDTTYCKCS